MVYYLTSGRIEIREAVMNCDFAFQSTSKLKAIYFETERKSKSHFSVKIIFQSVTYLFEIVNESLFVFLAIAYAKMIAKICKSLYRLMIVAFFFLHLHF